MASPGWKGLTTITLYTLEQLALPSVSFISPQNVVTQAKSVQFKASPDIGATVLNIQSHFVIATLHYFPLSICPTTSHISPLPLLYRLFLNPSISLNLSLPQPVFISRNRCDVFCSTILIYKRNCL